MTRIIRVNTCLECPHAITPTKCRAATYVDEAGLLLLRKFDPETYPKIPVWCPLEGGDGLRIFAWYMGHRDILCAVAPTESDARNIARAKIQETYKESHWPAAYSRVEGNPLLADAPALFIDDWDIPDDEGAP